MKRIFKISDELYIDLKNVVSIELKKEKSQIEWVFESGEIHYLTIPEKDINFKWNDLITAWTNLKDIVN